MGRYVDWSDCTNTYPSIARDRSAEQPSVGIIIEQAEGEVDARLAPRYTTPFVPGSSNVPQIVRALSVDIVFYRLNLQQDWAPRLSEYIDKRFEALLNGDAALVTSAGLLPASNVVAPWTDKPYRSVFGPDDPIDWSVSFTWQEDAADERTYD